MFYIHKYLCNFIRAFEVVNQLVPLINPHKTVTNSLLLLGGAMCCHLAFSNLHFFIPNPGLRWPGEVRVD
jgi:hypothetical protein